MKLGEKMLFPKLETRKITYENRMLNLENICGSLFIGVIDEDLNYETKIHISGYDHDQAVFMLPNDFIGKTVLIKYEKEVDREFGKLDDPVFYIDPKTGEVKQAKLWNCELRIKNENTENKEKASVDEVEPIWRCEYCANLLNNHITDSDKSEKTMLNEN